MTAFVSHKNKPYDSCEETLAAIKTTKSIALLSRQNLTYRMSSPVPTGGVTIQTFEKIGSI